MATDLVINERLATALVLEGSCDRADAIRMREPLPLCQYNSDRIKVRPCPFCDLAELIIELVDG